MLVDCYGCIFGVLFCWLVLGVMSGWWVVVLCCLWVCDLVVDCGLR